MRVEKVPFGCAKSQDLLQPGYQWHLSAHPYKALPGLSMILTPYELHLIVYSPAALLIYMPPTPNQVPCVLDTRCFAFVPHPFALLSFCIAKHIFLCYYDYIIQRGGFTMISTNAKPKRQRRNIPLQVRLTEEEYRQISEAARVQGMPVATYIRAAAIQMASNGVKSRQYASETPAP